uniref:BTB/POZ domain-containing protein 7-like n=1 Tax=Phallusia mammillata TaxID=59560 RepID=A0A6F9D810_9ASCI|nr:BTB/POZ domain-containing protein 7-like [Phallusia mammillata]
MTGTPKKSSTTHHDRKSKSGLSTLKKKLNIPKIYKRLASKLSVHGRQIRMLTSSWNSNDLKSLICEYELTATLKELSDAADLARPPAAKAAVDLENLCKTEFLCNLKLQAKCTSPVLVHASLFAKRTGICLASVQKVSSTEYSTSEKKVVVSSFPSKVDKRVKFFYSPSTCTLNIESKHHLPPHYVTDWISHVYGQKPWSEISGIKTLDRVVEKTKHFLEELEITNVTKQYYLKEDDLQTTLGGNSLFANLDNVERCKESDAFLEDFYTDLKDLWFSANITGDVKLIFSLAAMSTRFLSKPTGFSCHGFVLAARSTFFKAALSKHRDELEELNEVASPGFVKIELDSKVFSPRYIHVVTYAMYTDQVDLQRIIKDFASPLVHNRTQIESVSEDVKDLTELLYLGRFLGFPMLIQGCENALVDMLSVSNVTSILRWSSQPHGSKWLRRQTIRYIRDNFLQLSSSGVLNSMTCSEMSEIIRSDFVNSPELDVLRCVLKWGESELFRRIELREPNLVRSHVILSQASRSFRTSASQSLSTRRREVLLASNTEELHDCTASLLTHVRIRHILPANHEVLTSAIKRGVISCPPEHLLEWHHHAGVSSHNENTFFWLREKAGLGFSPPRLFLPHVDEAKAILEERLSGESTGNVNLRSVRKTQNNQMSSVSGSGAVPDALYMVGQLRHSGSSHTASCDKCRLPRIGVTSLATSRLKYIDGSYPVPKPSLAAQLLARERSLRQTSWLKRVLQLCHMASTSLPHCCCRSERNSLAEADGALSLGILCNLCRAERYVRLLVAREHGLPDVASDLLRRPHLYYDPDDLAESPPTQRDQRVPDVPPPSSTSAPRKLQKLFQKKSAPRKSCAVAEDLDVTRTWERRHQVLSSGSEQSLSDGSVDWHFPYNGVDMKGRRGLPGSSFWGSDSSIASIQKPTSMPDVAASAHSTIRSSRFSSSSSDSSRNTDNLEDPVLSRHGSVNSTRRTSAPSYSQYLSLSRVSGSQLRVSGSHFAGDSSFSSRRVRLRNPIPQLVLDGTMCRSSSDSPDIFADATNSLERDLSNQSTVSDHATNSSGDVTPKRLSESKETCL